MQLEDVEAVAQLDKLCFATPWSVSAYITEVHNHSGYYIVAKTDGKIIGFAGEWLIMDEAHITTIGVDPEFRGKRIGERLLVSLLSEAMSRGARRATLEVRRSNQVAQNLYNKYGFHTVSIRRGYYTDNSEDAMVMWTDDMRDPMYLDVFNANKESLGEPA
ncbi:MAG TPA: ribosomal protein S18-alanine N-acetyltransferase [Armatimonadota bacterium]